MREERGRATLRAWGGQECLQGLSALTDNIPSGAGLLDVKTLQSTPPGAHWESAFGMSEVEVWRAMGGEKQC